jgi:hypothetical protein
MNAAKEEVRHILEILPDDASLEDIQYHIYVRQKIEHGLEDEAAGRTLSEEEFDQRMARWLEPPAQLPARCELWQSEDGSFPRRARRTFERSPSRATD